MSCKYCSAIGDEKTFIDRPEKWLSATEFSKEVIRLKQKENMAREEIPEIIDKEVRNAYKLFRPPGECMNTDRVENKRMRGRIARKRSEDLEEKLEGKYKKDGIHSQEMDNSIRSSSLLYSRLHSSGK
jgi:hypothetical protein